MVEKLIMGSEMGSVVEAHALLCGPTQVLRRQTFLCELLYYEQIPVHKSVSENLTSMARFRIVCRVGLAWLVCRVL